jgi:hypothetical protein
MTRFAHEEEPTARDKALGAIAAEIRGAKSLEGLLESLIAFENECREIDDETGQESDIENELNSHRCNITELPTFGGTEPASTIGVWSWDKDSLLVGEGSFSDWRIDPRPMRHFEVCADRTTGIWDKSTLEEAGTVDPETWPLPDTDEEHFDIFEVPVAGGHTETCAVSVLWVD